ncbi:four-carbon acid sugar kinase family protein [Cyclobacterium plantarum]|uniref:four-carbon acid sugar kinase family protein n=1 Tax=Cyclobacterium plantarum TaxID=2716263 RepID=UPI003F70D8F8
MTESNNPLDRPYEKEIRKLFYEQQLTLVIVDDDPTGTQTAHDVPVLGHWTEQAFLDEFMNKTPLFFVLANTRSLTQREATARAREIGQNLRKAAEHTGRRFLVISRSDSTLRGYYPSEVEALSHGAGAGNLPTLLIPAFFEGGRITEDNVHYIVEKGEKIPVSETVFAQDKSFGYSNADLTKWVEEKTGGRIPQEAVKSLSISDIEQGEKAIFDRLDALGEDDVMVINNTTYRQLEKTCLALHRLIKKGKGFNFRTAASFVSAFSGMGPLAWHPQNRPSFSGLGGLIIVGSYVKKSTSQLEQLLKKQGIKAIPVAVEKIIAAESSNEAYLQELVKNIETCLTSGIHPVVYTSRNLISGDSPEESLAIGERVTGFLVNLVKNINIQPAFFIAKGGITSNDIAVKGLHMKKGMVLGQIIAGVPVWEMGEETRFPGMPYVVYPGNVGDAESLARVYDLFTANPTK